MIEWNLTINKWKMCTHTVNICLILIETIFWVTGIHREIL